jgi:hypothetical protein
MTSSLDLESIVPHRLGVRNRASVRAGRKSSGSVWVVVGQYPTTAALVLGISPAVSAAVADLIIIATAHVMGAALLTNDARMRDAGIVRTV